MNLIRDLLSAHSDKSASRAVLLFGGLTASVGLLILCVGSVAGAEISDALAWAVSGTVTVCGTGGYVGGLHAKRQPRAPEAKP